MNVTCSDRERIFEDGTAAEWAALEEHAVSCPLCAEEIRGWKSLSVAAQELRDYSDSPSFWPRIERALAEEAARSAQRQIALEDQRPERSGKRGIVIRTCDRQTCRGGQAATRKSRDAIARQLSRE